MSPYRIFAPADSALYMRMTESQKPWQQILLDYFSAFNKFVQQQWVKSTSCVKMSGRIENICPETKEMINIRFRDFVQTDEL